MIGKAYLSVVDYYDIKTRSTRKKARPVLVVAGPRNNDYTVLLISTVSNRVNLDAEYDLLIDQQSREILNLPQECFIRTHKRMPIHVSQLIKEKGDMEGSLPDLYLAALEKMEQYQKLISQQAL